KTNLRNEISNFQQRFDESFHEAWGRYKYLLRACPHPGFTKLHQVDTFYNALNSADQDSLNSAAGGNLLKRRTQDTLTIIKNKSKIAKLTHVVNQQTSVVTTVMTAILKQIQATPPPASVKAVEEIYITSGGAHPYYQCLAADGNTFLEFRDNIQGYVSAAAVNYNQVVPLSELEKIKMINEINMKSMQTQIKNVKNKLSNEMKTSIQASMSNQTNELKNMMASFFQMNTASTSSSGPLPSNTVANPKGELKAITTRSGDLTDPKLDEFTIKAPPPLVQKAKPHSQRNYVVHQRDPFHPNIPYPSRMHKQKQQEKDKVQIHKFWQMFKQLHINITLADALILIPKYQKMLKALLFNKGKLLELANTPFNENCSTVILKKLPEKFGDPGKFRILCSFSELKSKALADLGASINLTPLSVWKKLGLPELISTRMTLELTNREICTPDRIVRDIFVPIGKFTFPADFVIVDYESDPRVPLILGRHFLRTARALIDDYLEDLFTTNHLSGNPTFSSHTDLTSPKVKDDIFDPEGDIVLIEKLLNLDSTKDFPPPHNINPLSGSTNSSSPDHFLEEFIDELALITFPPGNDDLPFDIESDLREIEYLLNLDPIKEMDSILEDSIDEDNLAEPNDSLFDTIPKMFIDEHALDYSSPPLYDDFDDDLDEFEFENDDAYNDPFDSKGEKIKESKLLIDELDLPRSSNFLLSPEYNSFLFEDFFEVDALPSTNNKDKVFNPGILIHENLFEVTTRVAPDKNVKKIAISHASLILEDFDPPLFELPFHKEVLGSETLLSFSSENEEKVFKPRILTS
nr:hypothetical protein [Tanacetum cinerariifolium]